MSLGTTRIAWVTVAMLATAGAGLLAQGGNAGGGAPLGPQPVGTLTVQGIADAPTAIYTFGFEATNSIDSGSGSGGAAGKVAISEIVVTRQVDPSSSELFRAAVIGLHIPAARIELYAAGGKSVKSAFQLADVIITRVANDNGVESLSLGFSQVEVSSGGSSYCYNLKTNTAC
jgi:type VI protein secretion system component Hcp